MSTDTGVVSAERIWYDDPRGFLRDDRLSRFVPEPNTPLESQLNAAMRFALYLSVFVSLYRGSLATGVTLLVASAMVSWLVYRSDSENTIEQLNRMDMLGLQVDPGSQRLCTRPTGSNPYMNVLLSDYGRFPDRPGACDITRETVKAQAEDLAARDLYADSDDVYGRRASVSHQFFTNPSTTIPNDQEGFARWLYQPAGGSRGTCREGDGTACARLVL
jgi:hypothetical protein